VLTLLAAAAVLSATMFTSWALYITLVEHPARLDSGAAAGRAQFRPSYRRAAPWQAAFAAGALVSGASSPRSRPGGRGWSGRWPSAP
jgi:hypothetical protein